MSADKKTMTVEEARQSIIDAIECELDPIEWETKAKVDAAFAAVRKEADERWEKEMGEVAKSFSNRYGIPCWVEKDLSESIASAITAAKEKK